MRTSGVEMVPGCLTVVPTPAVGLECSGQPEVNSPVHPLERKKAFNESIEKSAREISWYATTCAGLPAAWSLYFVRLAQFVLSMSAQAGKLVMSMLSCLP